MGAHFRCPSLHSQKAPVRHHLRLARPGAHEHISQPQCAIHCSQAGHGGGNPHHNHVTNISQPHWPSRGDMTVTTQLPLRTLHWVMAE